MSLLIALLISSFTFTASAAENTSLDLSDVSVLFPLPANTDWYLLPHASSQAKNGTLLPLDYITQIPMLLQGVENEKLYKSIYNLGFRIDPCFFEGTGPLKCRPQIRLVWQPLIKTPDGTSTIDVTLHTFYDLSEEDFKTLVAEVRKIKALTAIKSNNQPLSINPVIKKEGLSGDYYNRMGKLIFKYIGESNLSRITFMMLFANETVWFFGGVEVKDKSLTKIMIPRANNTIQQFLNQAAPGTDPTWFLGRVFPEPQEPDNINILLKDSRVLSPAHEEQIIEAAKSAFKFENPKLHNPGTVDCVSCHAAQAARVWATRQYPWLQIEKLSHFYIYKSERNLQNVSPMQHNTNVVRMFGYFRAEPIVAQRVINESAETLDYINRNF